MIHVDATIEIGDEALETLRPLLREVTQATLLEAGCLVYRFTSDLWSQNRFYMSELWETEAALHAHLQAPAFLNVIGKLLAHARIIDFAARQGELAPYDLALPGVSQGG